MRRDESGSALTEFALLAPLVVLLLVGLIEVGRYAYFSIMVANAARAGAQYGAQNFVTADDSAGMQNAALSDGQKIGGLTAVATHRCQCSDGSASTCLENDCPTSHRLTYVDVTTTGTFTSILQLPFVARTFTVTNTSELVVDQ